jgi:putative ABC transport system permease protein
MSLSSSSSPSARRIAEQRVDAPHTSMFVRILFRAAVLRRKRAAAALLALVVAAAVATAMTNLYVDVQAKLRNEFRSYGANIIVVGKDNQPLPADAVSKVESTLGSQTLAVPFSYVVARTKTGQSVVVAGTDISRAQQLNRWWKVTSVVCACLISPGSVPPSALMGVRALKSVTPSLDLFELSFRGRTITLEPGGSLQTGADEDSRIYLDQKDFQNWTGVTPSTIEVRINGTGADIQNVVRQLSQVLPTADVRPVRQIVEAEANVLTKTQATLYSSATLVILTSALCVLATLMGWVFDRRRDFAIMKALGASQRVISGFVAAEAVGMGIVGAMAGFIIGIGVAAWIGRVNFHAPVVPRFSVFPYVLTGSILVALVAAIVPIGMLRRVEPAMILKGE